MMQSSYKRNGTADANLPPHAAPDHRDQSSFSAKSIARFEAFAAIWHWKPHMRTGHM